MPGNKFKMFMRVRGVFDKDNDETHFTLNLLCQAFVVRAQVKTVT